MSSAYVSILPIHEASIAAILAVYSLNSTGEIGDPCGKPVATVHGLDTQPPIRRATFLSYRRAEIQLIIHGHTSISAKA
jgi:hypothetical protein